MSNPSYTSNLWLPLLVPAGEELLLLKDYVIRSGLSGLSSYVKVNRLVTLITSAKTLLPYEWNISIGITPWGGNSESHPGKAMSCWTYWLRAERDKSIDLDLPLLLGTWVRPFMKLSLCYISLCYNLQFHGSVANIQVIITKILIAFYLVIIT